LSGNAKSQFSDYQVLQIKVDPSADKTITMAKRVEYLMDFEFVYFNEAT